MVKHEGNEPDNYFTIFIFSEISPERSSHKKRVIERSRQRKDSTDGSDTAKKEKGVKRHRKGTNNAIML